MSSVSQVETPSPTGPILHTSQAAIEEQIGATFSHQFQIANGTLFLSAPLLHCVGMDGSSSTACAILDGSFACPQRLMNTPDNLSPLSAVPQMFLLLCPLLLLVPLTSRPTGTMHENAPPPPILAFILVTTRLLLTVLPSLKSVLFSSSCASPMDSLPSTGSQASRWSSERKPASSTLTNSVLSFLWKLISTLEIKCSLVTE